MSLPRAEQPPDHVRLASEHFFSGLHALNRGDTAAAEVRFRAALELVPDRPSVMANLSIVLTRQGRLEEALALADAAVAREGANPLFLLQQASVLLKSGRHAAALEALDAALAIDATLAEAHNNRGGALKELGRFDAALDAYDRALALKPGYADAHSGRGVVLRQLKRYPEALAAQDRAIALNPNHVAALVARGVVLRELGRPAEALASHDRALALDPAQADAWSNRGVVLKDLGRLREALASHDKAISLAPDVAEAHVNRGVVLTELQRLDEALASHERALSLKPHSAEALSSRGDTLADARRLDAALASYDAAVKLSPGRAAGHVGRGWIFAEREEWARAREAFEAALERDPSRLAAIAGLASLPDGHLPAERARDLLTILDGVAATEDAARQLFTRAQLLARLGRIDDGFACIATGNARRAARLTPQDDAWRREFDALEARLRSWQPSAAAASAPLGQPGLLLILGASRSGKTSLERRLARDPRFCRCFEACRASAAHEGLAQLARQAAARPVPPEALAAKVLDILLPEGPGPAADPGARVLTITNPFLLTAVPMICDLHPAARFVFMARDAIDNAAEIFATDYADRYSFVCRPEAALEHVERYTALARLAAARMGGRALELGFDDMHAAPDEAVARVCRLLGLAAAAEASQVLTEAPGRALHSRYRAQFARLLPGGGRG